jgi:hypothetical protein
MADPVSWLLVEPGWKVVSSDGEEIGEIHSLVGDTGEDIFNGISVDTGMFDRPRYVPAERVTEIVEGRVTVALTAAEFGRVDEFEEPPASLELDGSEAGLADRVADAFTGPETRAQPVTPWRRLVSRLFGRR